MNEVSSLVDLLKSGGPYTLAVICMFVARHQYSARETMRAEHAAKFDTLREENNALHQKITDMAVKLMEVVTISNTSNLRIIEELKERK